MVVAGGVVGVDAQQPLEGPVKQVEGLGVGARAISGDELSGRERGGKRIEEGGERRRIGEGDGTCST